jgi:hypothetical protein
MVHTEYFGINAGSFKLALAFVGSRILRSNEIQEAWSKFTLMDNKSFIYETRGGQGASFHFEKCNMRATPSTGICENVN